MFLFNGFQFYSLFIISLFSIITIYRYIEMKKDSFLGISFIKFIIKNLFLFITNIIFIMQIYSAFYLWNCNNVPDYAIILSLIIALLLVFFTFVFLYVYINDKSVNNKSIFEKYKYTRLIKIIDFILEYLEFKILLPLFLFLIIMINTIICISIVEFPKHIRKIEIKNNIEEEIKNNNKIKLNIIIDKLLDKVDIQITDEDIENYKKNLIDKYSK